jgi:hypothetical protein
MNPWTHLFLVAQLPKSGSCFPSILGFLFSQVALACSFPAWVVRGQQPFVNTQLDSRDLLSLKAKARFAQSFGRRIGGKVDGGAERF